MALGGYSLGHLSMSSSATIEYAIAWLAAMIATAVAGGVSGIESSWILFPIVAALMAWYVVQWRAPKGRTGSIEVHVFQ